LINGLTELEVEAFPQDLPERITVDIAALVKIGDGIYVHDLVLSDKVTVHSQPDGMIVLATAPAKEEVEPVTAEAAIVAEAAEPEVLEKGKKEDEEDAEKK
jgi:large subunit ribosomal protein L25